MKCQIWWHDLSSKLDKIGHIVAFMLKKSRKNLNMEVEKLLMFEYLEFSAQFEKLKSMVLKKVKEQCKEGKQTWQF